VRERKMKIAATAFVVALLSTAAAFAPNAKLNKSTPRNSQFSKDTRVAFAVPVHPRVAIDSLNREPKFTKKTILKASSADDDDNDGGFLKNLEINPIFAATYIGFFVLAYVQSTGEAAGASQVVLEKFFADPINPGVNELFVSVFNLLGIVAFPLAMLLMPGANSKDQTLPAVPFLVGGMFAGFGSVGMYMSTRKPVTEVSQADLGWVTKNVLENKIFNWVVVALTLSVFYSTGFISAFLQDPAGQIQGYMDLFSQTAICSVSTIDLAILTLTAASLIPEDLKRRGMDDSGKAYAIAASTVLLPVVGSTIYCALRPSLPEE
jgi:hypothetical protein